VADRLRSARPRRAYAGDVAAWVGWLTERGTGALAAGPAHADLWAYAILVMTHGPGTLTGRTPVTVKVVPSGLVTLNVSTLTCRTTEPEP
jgi:hypothetical protein